MGIVKNIIKVSIRLKNNFKNSLRIISYENKRKYILENGEGIDTFIETGTFLGDTIEFLKLDFRELVSIELSSELAYKAKMRFKESNNIKIFEGDSGKILKAILSDCNNRCLFWLDGHYSSEFYIGDKYYKTAKGQNNTPIRNELIQILSHKIKNHIILIDDARLFNGTNDYPSIKEIKSILRKYGNYKMSVKNDIIKIIADN